jgi:flagellar motor switch protein FliN/FliY
MNENLSQEEIDVLLKGQKPEADAKEKIVASVQPLKKPGPSAGDAPAEVEAKAPDIRPVHYDELSSSTPVEVPVAGMDVLLDVPLAISVELGRARCFVKDLLNLSSGSVVELDKAAGDTVDILVNGKLFARGEVVVIDENFGVRIQEIVHRGYGEKAPRR